VDRKTVKYRAKVALWYVTVAAWLATIAFGVLLVLSYSYDRGGDD
jgi:hypothetical protein